MSVDPFKLAEQGIEVFPIRVENAGTPQKTYKFLTQEPWNVVASNDPAKIAEWNTRYGDRITDWGVPTGHRNGFMVIDIDTPEAEQWWGSKWLPAGKEVETPRGGLHVLYSLEDVDADLKTCQNNPYEGIDIRAEGGFVIAYTDDMSDIPELPVSVLELLPERQEYTSAPVPTNVKLAPLDEGEGIKLEGRDGTELGFVSPQEARVIKGLTDILDALPRPWRPGAGYHDAQFLVACGLNRMANSPYYHIDRDVAHAIFLSHAPLRDSSDAQKRDRRWEDAVKITEGQWFEAPSDVPVRLTLADESVANLIEGTVERLLWESDNIGDVKDLIRELREQGASPQIAYSISYESRAMRNIRAANPKHSGSTWGFVKNIYMIDDDGQAVAESQVAPVEAGPTKKSGPEFKLLDEDEAALVRNYPNFIDRYILASRQILAEPNLPLHYVNAWIALSCIIGDRADIILTKNRVPLSLWGMPLAPSAAGKGDAKRVMIDCIKTARRGGFGDINAGGSASSEGLSDFIAEREGKVTFFNKDESRSLLDNMHQEGSYEAKMMDLALDLYDGEANRNLRVGNAKEGLGESVKTTFNMWLQTTWHGAMEAMTPNDVETGFVGRFLIAIGEGAKITDESLRPQFASEFQVQAGGIHPALKSIGDGMNAVIGRVKNVTMVQPDDDVLDRYVKARKDALAHIASMPQADSLRGVILRVTDNMLKGAALLALSEGRPKIEMPDLLLALKSGQYWVRDAIKLVEAIGVSDYRKRINALVRFCSIAPRTKAQILNHFGNLTSREIIEILERAEHEGAIRKSDDGKRWISTDE